VTGSEQKSSVLKKSLCFYLDTTAPGTLTLGQQYLMEACELGLYMFSICALATLLQHPASPVRQFVPSAIGRRALMESAVGLTVVGIILTPWGKQSGGHFNPAITNELRSHIKQCVPKRHLTKPIEGQGLDQG